jgi:hypothetical protein
VSPRLAQASQPQLRSWQRAIHAAPPLQVYTAEEKAALALMHAEEAAEKEAALVAGMKRLVEESLGTDGGQ